MFSVPNSQYLLLAGHLSGAVEIISLNSSAPCTSTIPSIPASTGYGRVFTINHVPYYCSGTMGLNCAKFENGNWIILSNVLLQTRTYFANVDAAPYGVLLMGKGPAVELFDGTSGTQFGTISSVTSTSYDEHCAVNINETHFLFCGGDPSHNVKAEIFSIQSNGITLETSLAMPTGRENLVCGFATKANGNT